MIVVFMPHRIRQFRADRKVNGCVGAVVISSGAAHSLKPQISSNSTSECIAVQNKANLVAALLY